MTYALTDLTNLDPGAFAAAPFQIPSSGGVDRTLATRFMELPSMLDWNGASNAARLQNAIDALAAAHPSDGYQLYIPPGIWYLDEQIEIHGHGPKLIGSGRQGSVLSSLVLGAPSFILGKADGSEESFDLTIQSLYIRQGSVEVADYLFDSKWVRGIRLIDVLSSCDGFIKLGDENLEHPTYMMELYAGCEINGFGAAAQTPHFVDARNFSGQWFADQAMISSGANGAAAGNNQQGFTTTNNVQQRVDHFVVVGGYFSRFINNYNWLDGRVGNAYFLGHHSENAGQHALRIEASANPSPAKDPGNVGFEGLTIHGGSWDGAEGEIFIKSSRANTGFQKLVVQGICKTGARSTAAQGSGVEAVHLEINSGFCGEVIIDGVVAIAAPANTTSSLVTIAGSPKDVLIDNLSVNVAPRQGVSNPLASVVKITGTPSRIRVGANLTASQATKIIDDQSGLAIVNGQLRGTSLPQNWGSVAAATRSFAQNLSLIGALPGDRGYGVVLSGTVPAGVFFEYSVAVADQIKVWAVNPTNTMVTVNGIVFNVYADVTRR